MQKLDGAADCKIGEYRGRVIEALRPGYADGIRDAHRTLQPPSPASPGHGLEATPHRVCSVVPMDAPFVLANVERAQALMGGRPGHDPVVDVLAERLLPSLDETCSPDDVLQRMQGEDEPLERAFELSVMSAGWEACRELISTAASFRSARGRAEEAFDATGLPQRCFEDYMWRAFPGHLRLWAVSSEGRRDDTLDVFLHAADRRSRLRASVLTALRAGLSLQNDIRVVAATPGARSATFCVSSDIPGTILAEGVGIDLLTGAILDETETLDGLENERFSARRYQQSVLAGCTISLAQLNLCPSAVRAFPDQRALGDELEASHSSLAGHAQRFRSQLDLDALLSGQLGVIDCAQVIERVYETYRRECAVLLASGSRQRHVSALVLTNVLSSYSTPLMAVFHALQAAGMRNHPLLEVIRALPQMDGGTVMEMAPGLDPKEFYPAYDRAGRRFAEWMHKWSGLTPRGKVQQFSLTN